MNYSASAYPDFKTVETEYDYNQLEDLLQRLLKENEFVAEEIIIAEDFLKHNANASNAQSGKVNTDAHQNDDDNASDTSDTATNANVAYIKKKTKKRRGNTPQYHLSLDNKIEMVTKEMENIRISIENENQVYEREIEIMRAEVQEADLEIEEVDKEHFEFRRDVVIPETRAFNPRNGKLVAEKVLKYFDDKIKQRDALLD